MQSTWCLAQWAGPWPVGPVSLHSSDNNIIPSDIITSDIDINTIINIKIINNYIINIIANNSIAIKINNNKRLN